MSTIRFTPGARKRPPRGVSSQPILWPESLNPLVAPLPLPRTKTQIIVPVLIGLAFLGMMAMMFSQPGLRQGPMMGMSLLFPVMMLASMMMMFGGNRWSGGGPDGQQLTPNLLEAKRRMYRHELDELRDELHESARAQFNQVQWLHPAPQQLLGLVGSDRQWERSRKADR